MPRYLVRAEAVGFDDFIFGTNDISTIRGGGMLLRHALTDTLLPVKLHAIYVGGSTGLFDVDWPEADVVRHCEEMRSSLQQGDRKEAVFAVVACPWDGQDSSFATTHAEVVARSRWIQMQTGTFVLPAPGDRSCELDRLRPAVLPIKRKGASVRPKAERELWVSSVTAARREYGVVHKREHYKAVFDRVYPGEHLQYGEFTNDFEQMADYPEAGRLDGKIALIHLDGNKFGSILRSCAKPEVLQRWSETLEANWDGFLAWLLKQPKQPDWMWRGNTISNLGVPHMKFDALRIETLLWGGDEVLLAVPAWKGWWVLEKFVELYGTVGTRPATSFDPLDDKGARRLTFAGSLIFAHHNAPVQRLRRLAEELTTQAKILYAPRDPGHSFTYQALESFDHLGSNPEAARSSREVGYKGLVLDGASMPKIRKAVVELRKQIARSRLYDALKKLNPTDGGLASFQPAYDEMVRRAKEDSENAPALERSLADLKTAAAKGIPGASDALKCAVSCLHLAELWDYMPDLNESAGAGGKQ